MLMSMLKFNRATERDSDFMPSHDSLFIVLCIGDMLGGDKSPVIIFDALRQFLLGEYYKKEIRIQIVQNLYKEEQ